MLKRTIIAFIAVASVLLSGCTKEDVSMCHPGLQLQFSYLHNNKGVNLFGKEVNHITVFAFDEAGRYHSSFSDEGNHLTNDYTMTLPLPQGIYTLISWGGDMAHYNTLAMTDESSDISKSLTPGETTIDQFRLLLKQQENSSALGLYYGNAYKVESKTVNQKRYLIDLIKNSNTIRVHITGLDNLPSATKRTTETPMFDVTITAHNGRYNHENKIPSAAKTVQYKPHTTTENTQELTYDSDMLRLMIGREPALRVVNRLTGAEICNFNLVKEIMRDPKFSTQKEIDREDLFVFEFRINFDLSVSITINGWLITDVIPEL